MPNPVQNDLRPDLATFRRDGTDSHRSRTISVLFVHDDTELVENCVQELTKARFIVTADVVLTLRQCECRIASLDPKVAGEKRSPDG